MHVRQDEARPGPDLLDDLRALELCAARGGATSDARRLATTLDDILFTREGGEAYLKDLPHAEMHRLESGHFVVEDHLAYIAEQTIAFYDRELEVRHAA